MSGIESCPLDFEKLALRSHIVHGHSGLAGFFRTVADFYRSQSLQQFSKIMLSSNAFGNPQNFLNYFGDGAYAFLKEPYEGFQKLALDGMFGVGKGATSFFRNVTTGLADTGVKLISNLNQGLSTMALDPQYNSQAALQRRRFHNQADALQTNASASSGDSGSGATSLQERRAQHQSTSQQSNNSFAMFEGVGRGAESVLKGVAEGLVGVFSQPYEAVASEDRSVERFLEGTGRGVAGLFAKPLVGVTEGFKNFLEGIRDQAIGNDDTILRHRAYSIPRIRLPRMLYMEDRVLRPYSTTDARIRQFLDEHGSSLSSDSLPSATTQQRFRGKADHVSDREAYLLSLAPQRSPWRKSERHSNPVCTPCSIYDGYS
ncbi:unnamed protein product [Amoebophrya sp. A25]|nr:unnamed protein product [Amoebophrya sp. A25]|eukprot:GSA25T00027247001.1